jgi:hypothetical protein
VSGVQEKRKRDEEVSSEDRVHKKGKIEEVLQDEKETRPVKEWSSFVSTFT